MSVKKELAIGLIGAKGRLGKAISAIESQGIRIAAAYTRENPPCPAAKVDLFLDVSTVDAIRCNLEAALAIKKPIVIGTTGHADLERMRSASQIIPVFYSANFSLGMALMHKMAEELARRFQSTSIELFETHHREKKDAPSGTALMLARTIEKIHPVKIQSIRTGEAVGKHELHFQGFDESISLIHEAMSRDAFARGALMASRFLAVQSPGFYTMDDLIN
jgi:4-hydroxy-tetrahydrodipicolinate reductase